MLPRFQTTVHLRSSANKLASPLCRFNNNFKSPSFGYSSKPFTTSSILFNKHHTTTGILKRRSLEVTEILLAPKFKMEWPKITLYGDSITRRSKDADNGCWASYIAHKAGNFFDIDVRGFEGYNSKWALELMPKLFPKSYLDKVEIFIPFFGHNDSWNAKPLSVPVEEYESNMRAIIKYLVDNKLDKDKIILITPTWYHKEECDKFLKEIGYPPVSKTIEVAKQYSEAVKRIARDENIVLVDFFEVSRRFEPLKNMFCDGCHLSRGGAKMLYECLMPVIEKKIESSYKKPLADLWHVIPVDQHDEVKVALQKYRQRQEEKQL